ncbi:hypothetical protein HHK36_025822 [Tetracentron sinense]|uniref:Uncharacterized protein n=1 Tax=Tetracentron sinense TaxID=13715 RepID=A0A834YNX6_TETSI|nr:hypothetical protein HHK36_025822 [Tetracentron sinense]
MLVKFHKMEDTTQTKKTLEETSSGSSANIPSPKFEDFGKKRKWDSCIVKSFNVAERDELDHLIAWAFYVKSTLQRMVIDESWRFYKEEDSQKV